jgi:(p)ppGpp synthase/HD superfamily hydrolase
MITKERTKIVNIVENADRIAERAHASIDQRRKWGSENLPYIVHPRSVAAKVKTLPGATDVDVAAALLHDVIEDVAIKLGNIKEYEDEIREACGEEVLALVWELTSPSEFPEWDGKSREEKRAVDWPHLEHASNRAKRLKLVDRYDNLKDYRNAPKGYMIRKYLPESHMVVKICRVADEDMAKELEKRIEEAEAYFKKN